MDTGSPNVDELVAMLKARVEQRRSEGFYPAGLEDEMGAHFERIVAHRLLPDLADLKEAVENIEVVSLFTPARIPTESSIPGGGKVHATISKVVSRQTQGILEQVQQFADAVRSALDEVVVALQEPRSHVHADLVGQIDAIYERISGAEREPAGSKAQLADFRRRLEGLEAIERTRQFRPPYSNDSFETAFRGSRKDVLERYEDLAQRFVGQGPILDIGCGRGEFLELLAKHGVTGSGVELDPFLAAECRERGLDVRVGDGVDELTKVEDGSLGGIVLLQVVEHITPQQVVQLVATAFEKLRPGGVLMMETVNPQSLYVFAHAFYVDPTHGQPVHPAYLTFLVREAGFDSVTIDWRSPPSPDEALVELEGDEEVVHAVNENLRRLNTLLFAPQDYALIATR